MMMTPMMMITKNMTKMNNHNNNNDGTFFAQERNYLISNVAITKIVAYFTRVHATNMICTKQVNNNYNINNNNNHDNGQKYHYEQKLVIITKESRSETIIVVFSSAGKIMIFNPDLLAFCGHCQSRTHICSSIAHNHSLILKASKPLEVIIKMEKKIENH